MSALLAVAAVLTLLLADTALSVGASERTTQRIGVPVIGSAASAQSIERTPRTSGAKYTTLSGVSCASAKACTAVGNNFLVSTIKYVTLAEAWHGKTWAVRATPNPPHSDSQLNGLQAVSCTAASGCTAVGSYANRTNGLTLAESWKGKTWAIVATPNPKSAGVQRPVRGLMYLGQSVHRRRVLRKPRRQEPESGRGLERQEVGD